MRAIISGAIFAATVATGAIADPASGIWKTETGETGGYLHVQVAPCGAQICGTILKVFNSDNTSSEGKPIIWDMDIDGSGKYSGGRIWAPDVDKTYRSKMRLSGNTLKVSGCVGPICRSQNWTRVQ